MQLDERKKKILQAIIRNYLETGEPVGSRTISKYTDLNLSSATIRNEMADLEEIEVVGLCTDICVISNVMILKAKLPEVPIVVDASCCAGVTPQSHANALEAMKMCQVEVR